MSKSEDEKAALQADSGGAGLPGIRVPGDFLDKLTTEITPKELSAGDFKDYLSGTGAFGSDYGGGYSQTTTTSGGTAGVPLEMILTAKQRTPSMSDRFGPGGLTTLTGGDFSVGPDFGNLGIGMGDTGNFDPTGGLDPALSDFKEPKTFGQKAKDSIKGFLSKLARIHPATRNAAFAYDFVKGLQDAENPQDFVKGVMGQLAMRKVGGNLGLSGMQKQGIGGLVNMAQGKQNLAQTVGGLANSAVFRAAAPDLLKSVYKNHGMDGVYLAATALGMGRDAAGKGIYGALATPSGPGGGG